MNFRRDLRARPGFPWLGERGLGGVIAGGVDFIQTTRVDDAPRSKKGHRKLQRQRLDYWNLSRGPEQGEDTSGNHTEVTWKTLCIDLGSSSRWSQKKKKETKKKERKNITKKQRISH